MPMSLEAFIGQELIAVIPAIHNTVFQTVKLLGVETGGIWVESEYFTQTLLTAAEMPAAQTPIYFFPYSQIRFLISATDEMTLSDKAFGL